MAADMLPTIHSTSPFKSIQHLRSIVMMVFIWCFGMGSMDSLFYTLLFYHHKSGQIFHPWSILLTSYSHYYDDRTLWLIDWTTLISTYNMCASYFAFIWSEIPTRPEHSSSRHNDLSLNTQSTVLILCVCFGEDTTPFTPIEWSCHNISISYKRSVFCPSVC